MDATLLLLQHREEVKNAQFFTLPKTPKQNKEKVLNQIELLFIK